VVPGSPWENGVSESFNSRFCDEFLEPEEFEDYRDTKEKGDRNGANTTRSVRTAR
jgi:hypothetical protein